MDNKLTGLQNVTASEPDPVTGYRIFRLGDFEFSRDAYFATIKWPAKGQIRSHQMHADDFLRAIERNLLIRRKQCDAVPNGRPVHEAGQWDGPAERRLAAGGGIESASGRHD